MPLPIPLSGIHVTPSHITVTCHEGEGSVTTVIQIPRHNITQLCVDANADKTIVSIYSGYKHFVRFVIDTHDFQAVLRKFDMIPSEPTPELTPDPTTPTPEPKH
jgi:hypothetical protein